MDYIANKLNILASHRVQRNSAAAGAINGTGVDIGELEGPLLVMVDAPLCSASDTITFTVEHSYDNSTFAAVGADALVDPDDETASTFTVATDAVAVFEWLALKRDRLRRYVRVVATTAGSGVDVTFAAYILGIKKYTG